MKTRAHSNGKNTCIPAILATIAMMGIIAMFPNYAHAAPGDVCKTDTDCKAAANSTEKCDATTMKCVIASCTAPVTKPAASPATVTIVFSDSGNPTYGFLVSAALDPISPKLPSDVKTWFEKKNDKKRTEYNKRLESLVKTWLWTIFPFYFESKKQLDEMKPDKVVELLRTNMTILDGLRVAYKVKQQHGPQGEKGDTGPMGPTGPKGDPGACPAPDPGKSGPVK